MIQRRNESVVFKKGDKHARIYHTQRRMPPAHQSLRAVEDRLVGPHVEFGLVVNLELTLPDRRRKVLDQLFGKQLRLVHRVVISPDHPRNAALHGVCGKLGPVEAALDVQLLIDVGIHAHPQTDAVFALSVSVQVTLHRFKGRAIIRALGAVDPEVVRLTPACDAARLFNEFQDLLRNQTEHLVAVDLSIAVIDHMKLIDVQYDRVHRAVSVMDVELGGVAIEELLVI